MREKRLIVVLVLAALLGMPARGRAETSTEQRLRVLEEALRNAQQEIERLRREIEVQKAATEGTKAQVEETRKAQEEQAKKVEEAKKAVSLPDWLKRVSLFGDVRLRHEGFYNQPAKDGVKVTANNRERLRARIGLKAAFGDELSATVRIATGNPKDPISTNVTLDNSFTPEDINLDWAFITFSPGKSFDIRPGLVSVTGGKFPNPVFRPGEMVWDDDLSPEGTSEVLALLDKPVGPLQQVKVHALQWTFGQVSNAGDGWMFGGQVTPTLRAGSADIDVGLAQYWYLNDDLIAQQSNTNSSLKMTNAVKTATEGGKTLVDGFQSSFDLTNVGTAITFPNAVRAMPLKFWADYVHNWGAVRADRADGFQGGAKLGAAKTRGDWTVGTFYEYLEREATLSTFSNSDFGLGGTNEAGPVLTLEYQLLDPLTLIARNYFVNFIDRPRGESNPTLFRLQLDALLKF
jgi:hypothetical protein